MKTYAYGFPRLGENREYKKLIEAYWRGDISAGGLHEGIDKLEDARLTVYGKYVDKYPVGEMTLYDNTLDTALMLGLYKCEGLKEYYDLCNGKNALELTKWFNTNYHYLVPEFAPSSVAPKFRMSWNKPGQALEKYKRGIPYLIGPFTFLKLSKGIVQERFGEYLLALADIYGELIKDFDEVHIEEPAFVMELAREEVDLIGEVYRRIGVQGCAINLFTYYESVDFIEDLYHLPVKAIGLDFVNGKENLARIKEYGFPEDKTLIAGIVNGRNVWRADIKNSLETLNELSCYADDVVISNAAPLYHLPITTRDKVMDERLLSRLSFAEERLHELEVIARAYEGGEGDIEDRDKNQTNFGINSRVRERIGNLKESDFLKDVL